MPHSRKRHLISIFLKEKALWPVIGVVGAKQIGKSTLLRDQFSSLITAKYFTLDKAEVRKEERYLLSRYHRYLKLGRLGQNPTRCSQPSPK